MPFRDDAECVRWLRYPAPLDRSRRISIFAEASGLGSVDGLVDRVIAVQSGMRDLVGPTGQQGLSAPGRAGGCRLARRTQARIDWSREHRHLIEP